MSNGRRRKHHHHHLKASNASELGAAFGKLQHRYPWRRFTLKAIDGYLLVCVAMGAPITMNPEIAGLGRGTGSRWERIRIWTPSE